MFTHSAPLDSSFSMHDCRATGLRIEKDALILTFEDGVWACASLLHVPYAQLPVIFRKVARALKAGGYLYASFKYGDFEGERNGRYFTDLDEGRLAAVMQPVAGLTIVETFVTEMSEMAGAGRSG